MKARGNNLVHVFMSALLVYSLLLTCTAYAAPAAAQKSTVQPSTPQTSASQQTQSATGASPARMKYDPNAPPKGTITFNTSTKGNVNASTAMPGTYQYVQWTCNGTSSNDVDVTLWQNNSKVLVIGPSATGQTAYWVPQNLVMGNYEYRITSQVDARVEARKAVSISASITVTKPVQSEVLKMESNYEAAWSYVGNPGPVIVSYKNENGCERIVARSDQPSAKIVVANGQGKVTWTVQPIDDCYSSNPKTSNYHLFVKSTGSPQVSASSGLFSIPCKYDLCTNWQVCTNTKANDPLNCGKCDYACWAHGHMGGCLNGKCLCESGQTDCQGPDGEFHCTYVKSDQKNCGACGVKCDPYGTFPDCYNGTCICAPPNHGLCLTTTPGQLKCVDFISDSRNCGKCGNLCPKDQPYCYGGRCTNDPYGNTPADLNTVLPSPI